MKPAPARGNFPILNTINGSQDPNDQKHSRPNLKIRAGRVDGPVLSLTRCFSFIFCAKWSYEGLGPMCPYMAICPYMGTHGFKWHSPTPQISHARIRT